MATVIDALVHSLKASYVCKVNVHTNELLTTLKLDNGRSQLVKVTIQRGKRGSYHVAKCVSRACVAKTPAIIRNALEVSAKTCVGYSLETSLTPPAIDVTHGVLIPEDGELEMRDLLSAILHVATVADGVEHKVLGQDVF